MASLSSVQAGDPINSSNVNQFQEALSGQGNYPVSITGVNDGSLFALDVRNQDAANQRSFRVRNSSGETQIVADGNGVTLAQVAISSGTITGSTLSGGNVSSATLTNPSVSTTSPGVLSARLDSTTLGSSAGSMVLTVTSTAYAHLEAVLLLQNATNTVGTSVFVQFNGDTGANYDYQRTFTSTGSTVPGFDAAMGSTGIIAINIPGSTALAGTFAYARITIPGYASTLAQKVMRSEWCYKIDNASSLSIRQGETAGFWRSTAPITAITLLPGVSAFSSGSRGSLYGKP